MALRFACRVFRKLRLQSLDSDIGAAAARRLAQHLSHCADCRDYDQQILAITNVLRESKVEYSGSHNVASIVVAILRSERLKKEARGLRPVLIGAAAAVVALGAIVQVISSPVPQASPEGAAIREYRRDSLRPAKPGQLNIADTPSRLIQDPERTDA